MSYVEERLAEIRASHDLQSRAARKRYRNVSIETTRHGRKIFYYRVGNGKRIRLPDPSAVSADAFNQAYLAAQRGDRSSVPSPSRPVSLALASPSVGKKGFVYFLRMGVAVKIGFATNVASRVKSMQTGCLEPTTLLGVIPGTDQTERYFHVHFAAYRQKGEWFRLEGALASFLAVTASLAPPQEL